MAKIFKKDTYTIREDGVAIFKADELSSIEFILNRIRVMHEILGYRTKFVQHKEPVPYSDVFKEIREEKICTMKIVSPRSQIKLEYGIYKKV